LKESESSELFLANDESLVYPSGRKTRLTTIPTFKALQYRNFALLWFGLILSNIGTWIQVIAQSLLVLALTHNSGVALGVVSFAQASPFFIFALVGGSIADRVDKRNLLLFTQSTQILLAFTLGMLTFMGLIQFWHILVISVLSGITLSFDQPTRFALVPFLVPREDLSNAISLNSVAFNGAAIIGPALGGVLVVLVGFAGNFFLNGMSFVAVLIALFLMKIPKYVSPSTHTVLRGIREGLGYIWKENLLVLLLVNYGSLLFFGATYMILLSLFAVVVLSANPVDLGLLYSALGLGTIIGSFGLASLGDFKRKGSLLMASSILFSLSVIVFSFSRVLWLSFILLLVVAGTQAISGALTVTSLQLKTPRHMLGLVMSLNTLIIMGIRPMGAFPFGALANVIGVAASIAVGAMISGMVSIYLFSSNKRLRNV
jgi:predicted MFS family arabinose efflux permease